MCHGPNYWRKRRTNHRFKPATWVLWSGLYLVESVPEGEACVNRRQPLFPFLPLVPDPLLLQVPNHTIRTLLVLSLLCHRDRVRNIIFLKIEGNNWNTDTLPVFACCHCCFAQKELNLTHHYIMMKIIFPPIKVQHGLTHPLIATYSVSLSIVQLGRAHEGK